MVITQSARGGALFTTHVNNVSQGASIFLPCARSTKDRQKRERERALCLRSPRTLTAREHRTAEEPLNNSCFMAAELHRNVPPRRISAE